MLRSLRGLTRLAMTALVLALTFGGAPAADVPFPATAPALVAPVNEPPAATSPVDGRADAAGPAPRDPVGGTHTGEPADSAPVATRPAPPAADPFRGPLGLRGPPRR